MEIPKNELERVRKRYEARGDHPGHASHWVATIDRDASRQVGEAARRFADGGGLRQFAESYRPLLGGSKWGDGPFVRALADGVGRDEAGVGELRTFVALPAGEDDAAGRVDGFAEWIAEWNAGRPRDGSETASLMDQPNYFSPMILSVCWHGQDSDRWQLYTGNWLDNLRSEAGDTCRRRRRGTGKSFGERYVEFSRAIGDLSNELGVGSWNLTLKMMGNRRKAGGEPDAAADGHTEKPPAQRPEPAAYSMTDAMKDLFLPEPRLREILDSLRSRRNLILQGPPGVGKTFIAKRIAWCLIRREDDSSVETVQFHQSYAYEDFVQGFRPTDTGGFRRRNGVFFEFCGRAERDLKTPHVFVIDEINRGNLSRIFGELLMLLEADKRGPRHAVRLTYQNANEEFSVPENVYILGLMNTADRSLAVVDYALRRRFAFEELEPQFDRKFQDYLRRRAVAHHLIDRIVRDMESLNERIRQDEDLGYGFEIGHSYFVPHGQETADENWRRHRVRSQILPLLREYWFDRKGEVRAWRERLLGPPDGD